MLLPRLLDKIEPPSKQNYDQNILSWSKTIFEKYPWESREGKLYGNYPEGYRLAVGVKETGEGELNLYMYISALRSCETPCPAVTFLTL